jgi:hypothetical protein
MVPRNSVLPETESHSDGVFPDKNFSLDRSTSAPGGEKLHHAIEGTAVKPGTTVRIFLLSGLGDFAEHIACSWIESFAFREGDETVFVYVSALSDVAAVVERDATLDRRDDEFGGIDIFHACGRSCLVFGLRRLSCLVLC